MIHSTQWLAQNLGTLSDETSKTLSNSDFLKLVVERAHEFKNLGFQKGDRVLICYGNSIAFFVDLFACWQLQICVLPLDERMPDGDELKNLITTMNISWVLKKGEPAEKSMDASRQKFDPNDDNWEALIMYTSGSTGLPKGVVHGARDFLKKMDSLKQNILLSDIQISACLLPTHFGHGLICNSLFPLLNKCHLVILAPFNLDVLASLSSTIDKYKITFFSSVPAIWQILGNSFSPPTGNSLKRIHCASAPLSQVLWTQIKKWGGPKVKIKNVYGTTEAMGWFAGTDDTEDYSVEGAVGRGWGTEIKILSNGQEVPANQTGEIWIKTETFMKYYWPTTHMIKDVFHEGWFFTGDLGYMNTNSVLFISGRKDFMINRAGMKIQPEEVETFLLRHPAVKEACVFAAPDKISSETVAVALVFNEGQKESYQSLFDWCSSHLISYKIPALWTEIENIPKTARGKMDRKEVKNICLQRNSFVKTRAT